MPNELELAGSMPAIVTDSGEVFSLGCLPPDDIERHPKFGAYHDIIPISEWKPISSRHFALPVFHQKRTNSCTGQAVTGAVMSNRARARWRHVPLSPYSVYAMVNGGRDNGAGVGQILDAARKYGIGEASLFPDQVVYQNQINRTQLQNMQQFRITEAYKVDSFEEGGTALMRGFDLVFGIAVGNNFSQLSNDGVAAIPDRVIGGHALRASGLYFSRSINAWTFDTTNSWGPAWGDRGWCRIRREHFNPAYGFGFDAFAVAFSNLNPDDFDVPAIPRSN